MRGRITVSFNEELMSMLRKKQAEIMLDENRHISISGVVSNPTTARIIAKATPILKIIVLPFPPDDTPSFNLNS